MKRTRQAVSIGLIIGVLFVFPLSSIYGFGEPPSFDKKAKKEAREKTKDPVNLKKKKGRFERELDKQAPPPIEIETTTQVYETRILEPTANRSPAESLKPVQLKKKDIKTSRKIKKLLKQKQFSKLYKVINSMPASSLSPEDQKLKQHLQVFDRVDRLAAENESLFKKEAALDDYEKRTVSRLYKGAQESIIQEKTDLAKDLLVQTLYIDRKNYKAKKLMELGLGLPLGSYKVENVEAKYWKSSLVNFYSGFPLKAVDDLKVLEYFDPQNPTVFERMGSFYYSSGQPKKAINAWRRALYLDPTNKELSEFIDNASKEMKRQDDFTKQQLTKSKKRQKTLPAEEELQLLRVVNDANVAYSYAQEVKKQMPGVRVVVEEMDNGKYAVKIPKKKDEKGKKEVKKP